MEIGNCVNEGIRYDITRTVYGNLYYLAVKSVSKTIWDPAASNSWGFIAVSTNLRLWE